MQISFWYEGRITQEITWLAPGYSLPQVLTLLKNNIAHTTLVHSLEPSIVRTDTNEVIAKVRTVNEEGRQSTWLSKE